MSILGLFEGYGIELEYMIVDKKTLGIRTISDVVMKEAAGKQVSDFIDGDVTWSNELVLHVIELKTSGPAKTLSGLESSFLRSLKRLQGLLEKHDARLLPTAMHPLMQPTEMKLWPHDNNDIYDCYDRIFGCKGHGWSNLQSMHINLPFRTDDEFERLHTAIRFLLPILPALAASSPVVEGKTTDSKDNRLLFYQGNQARVPSIAGQVIPEPVASIADYHKTILEKIYADITPHDPDELMRDDWLNSRGAIARFERQTIEIRVLDLQETPSMDLAIAQFIVGILKHLVSLPEAARRAQRALSTESLKTVFDATVTQAEAATLTSRDYLEAWATPGCEHCNTAGELFQHILKTMPVKTTMSPKHVELIEKLLSIGSLSTRIVRALGEKPTHESITSVYTKLAECLEQDKLFQPA
jgi:carboxylate-amine ligase